MPTKKLILYQKTHRIFFYNHNIKDNDPDCFINNPPKNNKTLPENQKKYFVINYIYKIDRNIRGVSCYDDGFYTYMNNGQMIFVGNSTIDNKTVIQIGDLKFMNNNKFAIASWDRKLFNAYSNTKKREILIFMLVCHRYRKIHGIRVVPNMKDKIISCFFH